LTGILQLQPVASVTQPSPLLPPVTAASNQTKAEAIAQQVVAGEKGYLQTPPGIDLSVITQKSIASLNASSTYRQVSSDITKRLLASGLSITDLPMPGCRSPRRLPIRAGFLSSPPGVSATCLCSLSWWCSAGSVFRGVRRLSITGTYLRWISHMPIGRKTWFHPGARFT
jgi:hypothetical protein